MKKWAHTRLQFESHWDEIVIPSVLIALIQIVAIQQFLPLNAPLPIARVNGRFTYVRSNQDILSARSKELTKEITLVSPNKSHTFELKDLGIRLDEEKTLQSYQTGTRISRLTPFSIFKELLADPDAVFSSSQKSLSIVTDALADELNTDALNASLNASEASVTIVPSQSGVFFDPKKSTYDILDAITHKRETVTLRTEITEPAVSTQELESVTDAYLQLLPDEITITLGATNVPLKRVTMQSWLSYEIQNDKPVLGFDAEKVQIYADSLVNSYGSITPPTKTVVTLIDGIETGRIAGSAGQQIVVEDLIADIREAIANTSTAVTARVREVQSPITYARSYTRTQSGLQELIDTLTDGKDIGIRYVDLNDRGWSVGSKDGVRTRMASTYKLFVVYSVLKRVDSGQFSMSDTVLGMSRDMCIQKVIIESNNECSIAMAEQIGWGIIESEGKALGATGLVWSDACYGTARDPAELLVRLARGDILSQSSREYFIGLLNIQKFRQGIPAGTVHQVANKVGFLDGHLNDAGIIYAPDMTRVLVIYTYGESWNVIAEITRQIESLTQQSPR
jgi:beta-lactamase class A